MRPDYAFHFTRNTLRGGEPLPAVGETLRYADKVVLGSCGLHWSRLPFHALRYAPGHMLHLVRVGGEIHELDDKGVSSERTIVATLDVGQLLRRFAADQALSVAHLWDMPNVVRDYLTTLAEHKRAAAERAAGGVHGRMIWSCAAGRASFRAANWEPVDAARSATESAAQALTAAAGEAALRLARQAAREDFNRRVYIAFGLQDEQLHEPMVEEAR